MQFGLDLEVVQADRDMVVVQPVTNEGTQWVHDLLGETQPAIWGVEDINAFKALVLESSLRFKFSIH